MSSIKDLKSMCANTPCRDCRLLSWCESRDRISELPDDTNEIVDAYVSNYHQKTYTMDFFEKFPNARTYKGIPTICLRDIHPELVDKCYGENCLECWNREIQEQ
jgi:hypothetical protein